MPIKTDGKGKRWVEMEFIAPGTPEQVWQAMATGPGNSAWFARTKIEEQVGGALRFDFFEGASSAGEVTIWEPPHRFGYVEREWSEGAPPVATEITITNRSGGKCVVRMVHSLFSSTDDWDDQMEGFEGGWPAFFEILRIYLSHFAGRRAASFHLMASTESDQLPVWKRLMTALDLDGANVGERRGTSQRPEALSGIIEHVRQDEKTRVIIMRLDAPAAGVVMIGTYGADSRVNASMFMFLYGDDAKERAGASEGRWREWFAETVAAGA